MDKPVKADDGSPEIPQRDNNKEFTDVQSAVESLAMWMKTSNLEISQLPENAVQQTIMKNGQFHDSNYTESMALDEALKLIVHYVADIHQPLHTCSYYSVLHPKGNRGGNLSKIKK